MSFSPTTGGQSGGEIEAVLRQMIEQYLTGMQISSAAGDSPKINKVTSIPEITGFGSVIDNAVQTAVLRHMEDNNMLGNTGNASNSSSSPDSKLTEGQAAGLVSTGVSRVQNPVSLVSDAIPFLPHAVLVTLAISLIPIIITELTKPGGPFDLRFKRAVEKEFNSLMDRQTQYDVRIGERSIIVQSKAGFINKNGGATNTNTLRMIREGGINKEFLNEVDYIDHSKGLY